MYFVLIYQDNYLYRKVHNMKKALFLGILSSLFFAFTFILNKQMNLSGSLWSWSASLRYIFMLPILFFIIIGRKEHKEVISHIKNNLVQWLLWSFIGFGIFYGGLCYGSQEGESWVIAGTWQITIIAGVLLSPFFYTEKIVNGTIIKIRQKIPHKTLGLSTIILLGIVLMQINDLKGVDLKKSLIGILWVLIGAFAYPLGNRKMMELCKNSLNTIQRVYGMTLASMPLWIILSIINIANNDFPSSSQIFQSLIVAIFSGVVATILFFKATDLVKNNMRHLAIVESTQAGEVIFSLLGTVILFNGKMPNLVGYIGLILVVLGMVLNSFVKE